jgi:hypothetical protein
MLTRGKTRTALELFKQVVINQSRTMLTRKRKNVTRELFDSIKGDVDVMKNSMTVKFTMNDYAYYQDLGVHGAKTSYPLTRQYGSLAKFGKTKTKQEGGLSDSIKEWVRKRRFQFRDKKTGRFMSYNSTAYLISRSIYNKGLKPSLFFTKPFQNAFKTLPQEVVDAYALDIESFIEFTLKK